MMNLTTAPRDTQLRIVDFSGGHSVRRRLMALGLHKNDIVEMDSRSILGGPILIKDLTSDTSVAVGRGIARNILVEIIGKKQ
jgi:Fe2+ transport system protein FeoA